jgi:SPP1 gp7 family putative phage head morphogenesis protein
MMMNRVNLEEAYAALPGPKDKPPKALRPIGSTLSSELQVQRLITSFLREAAVLIRRQLMPLFPGAKEQLATDKAIGDDLPSIAAVLKRLRDYLESRGTAITPRIMAILQEEEARHRKAFITSVKSGTNIDLSPVLRSVEMRMQIEAAVQAHVALIRGISDDLVRRITITVLKAAQGGERQSALAKTLAKQFKFSNNRAKLIARDQMASFNAALNKARQTQVGVKRYEWSTSMDERVRGNPEGLYPHARPSHWAREGKIYNWSQPPTGGHPGEDIQCRCTAIPVIGKIK